MSRLKSPVAAAFASAVVTAGVLGGVAIAQTDGTPTVINACVHNQTGNVRIVGGQSDCRQNERFATWGHKGDKGDKGDPGAQGPQGETGAMGPAGPQGPAGPRGPAGPVGPEGPVGPQGQTGAAGADGADGAVGPQGREGPQGPAGPQGPPGPAGVGVSDLDALRGTPCNVGSTNEGTLGVSYTAGSGAVTLTCPPTGGKHLSVRPMSVRDTTNCGGGFMEPCGFGQGRVTGGPGSNIDCILSTDSSVYEPSVSGTCSGTYGPTTVITLTAIPFSSVAATFLGWGGACSPAGTSRQCTVTMSEFRTVEARFGKS